MPKDPNDEKNVIMEIRAGTGGEEAALFAAVLFRMYTKYAERKGWTVSVMDASETEIGGNMVWESFHPGEEDTDPSLAPLGMLLLAVATSIDALTVGVSFAFLAVDIVPAVLFIGVCTFVISAVGVKIGSVFGMRYRSKAELAGGVVLILIGLKILLEHLGLAPWL